MKNYTLQEFLTELSGPDWEAAALEALIAAPEQEAI